MAKVWTDTDKTRTRRTQMRGSGGAASEMVDPFETPRERRRRYLRDAEQAQKIAEGTSESGVRERYVKLAALWVTLASEVREFSAADSDY